MRPENIFFEVTPQVVRADRKTTIAIRPLFDHCRFQDDAIYSISIYPAEEIGKLGSPDNVRAMQVAPQNGIIHVPAHFGGEQEHTILVEAKTGAMPARQHEFMIYSLEPDLFRRRPFKGDLHIHSRYSDGREAPAYVAGAGRRIGLDFMAITDHQQHAPSLEAIRTFQNIEIDLRLFPGEEVHAPDNRVHIVNFGGRVGIAELFKDETSYRTEVRALEAELSDLPEGDIRFQCAACAWCYRKIREAGGLAVFCHPYWVSEHRYNVPEPIIDWHFKTMPCDALELIGGYFRSQAESNILQVARYHEERARGRQMPIVGASDAHGCERGELFGWYYSIVFAPSMELPDLIRGVKEAYAVAVEALPGEVARAFGPFRLVKYAQFLMREIFPLHDELCREEGRLMLAHLAGDARAAGQLRDLKGRVGALYQRLWDRA